MDAAGQKDRASVRIFPPGVPLLTILLGVALNRLWPIDVGFTIPTPERYWIGGAIVVAAFFGLGIWSIVLFRRSGQNPNPWKATPQIVGRGPYRLTRNPMYLQMMIECVGIAVILMNVWIVILVPLGGWLLQRFAILPEEAYLEQKFGEAYLSYKRRVRRWL